MTHINHIYSSTPAHPCGKMLCFLSPARPGTIRGVNMEWTTKRRYISCAHGNGKLVSSNRDAIGKIWATYAKVGSTWGKLQDHIERNKHKWSPGYHSMHPSMIWVRGQLTGNLQVIPRYPKGMFVSKTSSGHPSSVNRFDSSCLWPTHIHLGL